MEQKTDAQKTILIVEDEKNIVDILRFNLQREGYRTVEAYDGADGLEKARKENPDLILLDVMLPKMIGFDVCRTLREEGNNVPVIILTAREEEADKVSGPGDRRRRLHHQALLHAGADRPGGSQHPPHGHERRRRGHRCGHSHAGGRGPLHRHGQPSGLPGRQASGPDHSGNMSC